MTRGMVCVNDGTYGGVYYSDDIVFGGASQPTWTKLSNTGLSSPGIEMFAVDENDPYNLIYVKIGNVIYKWNGASWDTILNTAIAGAVVAPANDTIRGLCVDPVTRRVWSTWGKQFATLYPLYSDDFGATWNAATNLGAVTHWGNQITVYNSVAWVSREEGDWWQSVNNGVNWSFKFNVLTAGGGSLTAVIDRTDTDYLYTSWPETGSFYNLYRMKTIAIFTLVGLTTKNTNTHESIWQDPITSGHCITMINNGSNQLALKTTTDSYASSATGGAIGVNLFFSKIVAAREDPTKIAFWLFNINNPGGEPSLQALEGEGDTTPTNIGGTNTNTPPYTNAVPSDFNIAYDGLWLGEGIPQGGVFVYADEQGDITDIPDPDNLGVPMFGDRSSWRDMPADGYDIYHAEDVEALTPQIHAPWDEGSPPPAGYGIISDGTKWEVSTDEIALVSDLHDPVTLDADVAAILDLNVQEIGLDVQDANEVFAGPAAGAANEPTFRLLVEDDIPVLPYALPDDLHSHVYQEIWEGDGAEDQFFTANEFETETTQVHLNGLLQVNGDDYDEDPGLGSITFVDPPEDVDTIQIAYIMAAA